MPDDIKVDEPDKPDQPILQPSGEKFTQDQWNDKTKQASDKWNKAKDSGRNEILSQIKEKTGIDNLDDLEKIIKTHNEAAEKEGKLAAEYQKENEKLLAEKEELSKSLTENDIKNRLISAISTGHKVHNVDSVLGDFMREFKINVDKGQEIVYNKGKETPLLKENRPATISEVLTEWSKVEKNKHQFMAVTDSHLDTTGQPITKEDTDILKNPAVVTALKATGQWRKYLMGEKINMKTVNDMVSKKNSYHIVS